MSQSISSEQTHPHGTTIGDGILAQTGESLFAISVEGFIEHAGVPIAVVSVVPVFELADVPGRYHAQSPPDHSQYFPMAVAEVQQMFQDTTGPQTVNPIYKIQRIGHTENRPRYEIER
ncbi:hypothetical protein RH831_10650 [Halodesulfurarchaeum sp. HSR-GB]|uniref:hypothetical protein n=1 Tax=Halodesulfurarchaeum sp. HSR-GB TaxID=3074077 RepID=UPI00285C98F3|nr:hypothetical protein [Halodesulfurarchaeum sp. HSR-GB]MDR5657636.1 hypothetical protein [Halodesulfurarchaeum sp. HSR-GB]